MLFASRWLSINALDPLCRYTGYKTCSQLDAHTLPTPKALMSHKKRNTATRTLSAADKSRNIKRTKNGTQDAMPKRRSVKRVEAKFFATDKGNEPVREWLKKLPQADRKAVGIDIMTVEVGWPIGMPTCDHIRGDLWEIRSQLDSNRIARTLFFQDGKYLVLTHGFIKKSQTTPKADIDLALKRIGEYRS